MLVIKRRRRRPRRPSRHPPLPRPAGHRGHPRPRNRTHRGLQTPRNHTNHDHLASRTAVRPGAQLHPVTIVRAKLRAHSRRYTGDHLLGRFWGALASARRTLPGRSSAAAQAGCPAPGRGRRRCRRPRARGRRAPARVLLSRGSACPRRHS
jgi:hypothetical protein